MLTNTAVRQQPTRTCPHRSVRQGATALPAPPQAVQTCADRQHTSALQGAAPVGLSETATTAVSRARRRQQQTPSAGKMSADLALTTHGSSPHYSTFALAEPTLFVRRTHECSCPPAHTCTGGLKTPNYWWADNVCKTGGTGEANIDENVRSAAAATVDIRDVPGGTYSVKS